MSIFISIFQTFFFVILTITLINIFAIVLSGKKSSISRRTKSSNLQNKLETMQRIAKNSKTHSYDSSADHNADHDDLYTYQKAYANKNSDSEQIKDKPLSEAERNVLFGK